jgi:hypothetical protein
MISRIRSVVVLGTLLLGAAPQTFLYAHEPEMQSLLRTTKGDIAFELIGQVLNVPMTPTSNQYGYLSFLHGLDSAFTSTVHDDSTARFTFSTDASNVQVITNGNLRIVDRTGATTIYYQASPVGTFGVPSSFASGEAAVKMSLKQQVILDLVTNTFTTVNINTVTSATTIVVDGKELRLADVGEQFRTEIHGEGNTTGTPAGFVIAGYAVPIADFGR